MVICLCKIIYGNGIKLWLNYSTCILSIIKYVSLLWTEE